MKKSLSSKFLALFLAVLMLVTSVPLVALAGTDSEYNAVVAAINYYESKMDGTVYNGGMKNAYVKYAEAKKLADAFWYGNNTSVDFANVAKELTEAVDAMVSAKAPQTTFVNAVFAPTDNGNNIAQAANFSRNILWNGTFDNHNANCAIGTNGNQSNDDTLAMHLYYGDTVLLLDGVNTPMFPILLAAEGKKYKQYDEEQVHSVWPGSISGQSDKFGLNDNRWYGANNNGNVWGDNFTNNKNYLNGNYITSSPGGNASENGKNPLDVGGAWKYFSSAVTYLASDVLDGEGRSVYAANYNIPWAFWGWGHWWVFLGGSGSPSFNGQGTSGSNTAVVNGKAIQLLKNRANGYAELKNPAKYLNNYTDMVNLFTAIDYVAGFNPSAPVDRNGNSINYASTSSSMNQINTEMNWASSLIKTNYSPNDYDSLRTAITNARNTLKATDVNTKTPNSVAEFKNALSAAEAVFADTSKLYGAFDANITSALNSAAMIDRASFAPVNDAVAKLAAALEDFTFTADTLGAVKSALEAKPYYNNTDKANVPYTENGNIANEAASIEALIAQLVPFNSATSDAVNAAINGAVDNTDKYNTEELRKELEKNKVNCGGTPITIAETSVIPIDENIYAAYTLTAINTAQYDYTVTINGKPYTEEDGAKDTFHYGDEIVLPESKNGYLVEAKAAETEAPLKSYVKAADKLVVRGDMTITSCDAPQTEASTLVTFRNFNTGKVMAAQEIANGATLELASVNLTAPAFYTLTGEYTVDGAAATSVTANGGTIEVWVHVAPISTEGVYKVTINGVKEEYKYDKAVPVAVDGAKGYKDGTGEIIWIGEAFTLRVLQDVEIVPVYEEITVSDGKSAVSYAYANAILANGRTRLYGSFATAEDVEIVTQGVILDVSGTAKELTLANVNNANKMFNYSATQVGKDMNQYCISIPGTPKKTFQFVTYVTYKDGDKDVTVYSAVRTVNPASEQA